jgi:hypothetical protein
MKENSKEKLERQLNENPELKERFNLQMKSITESVKENTAPFEGLADSVKALENLSLPLKNIMNSFKAVKPTTATQSIVESLELFNLRLKPLLDSITSDEHKEMILLMDKTKLEYTSLRKSEREFIEHEGLYIPNDVYEFLDWYLYCYLFDKPIDTRKKEELGLYHFNLFYTFKQRYKKHKKWGVEDERKFIKELESSDSDNKANVSDEPKKQGRPKAIIHDVSYYLVNEKLLSFLISKYSEVKPQFFNHLIRVLIDLGQLKPATKKEYKEAFGEALNVEQTQTNFDNSFNIDTNTTIYEPIKKEIMNFLDDNNM